jgi:hypothetical protein
VPEFQRLPSKVADPTADLWGRFSDLLDLAIEDPKEFKRKVRAYERLIEAHRHNSSIMRLRGAEYDAKVEEAREEWANWLAASVAAIRMQAGL